MRWLRPSLAVLGALFLLTATLAYSDYGVQDKGTYYSGPTGEKTDAYGNRAVVDMDRDRNNWRLIPLLNSQVTGSGTAMAESLVTPVATYDMRRMNLLLKGNFDSLSTVVRIAVQIRGHWSTGNDSSLTFPWYRWPTRATSNGTTDWDSLGHMYSGSYALAQVTTANVPSATNSGLWGGEFIVKFNVAGQDSTALGNGKYGADPRTLLIPLVDAGGAWFNAPYTSIRIRTLSGVRSRFKIKADLMGVSK
jgi:hypothetical protein